MGHFRDMTFQAIDQIGIDNQKQGNKTPYTTYTLNRNSKNCPS